MNVIPDEITRELRLDAPVESVWPLLGTAEGFARWFCDRVEGEWRKGEMVTLVIGEIRAAIRIEELTPPRRLVTRGMPGRAQDGAFGEDTTTLVTYTLVPEGERTKLILRETGFAKLGREEYDGNQAGWDVQLPKLQEVFA